MVVCGAQKAQKSALYGSNVCDADRDIMPLMCLCVNAHEPPLFNIMHFQRGAACCEFINIQFTLHAPRKSNAGMLQKRDAVCGRAGLLIAHCPVHMPLRDRLFDARAANWSVCWEMHSSINHFMLMCWHWFDYALCAFALRRARRMDDRICNWHNNFYNIH